jgi:chromosome segregation ATPase
MNELQAQLDEVNAQIAEEQAKGAQKDADVLAGLEQKQAVILMKMDDSKLQEEQQAAQQVRIQAQEEKVATLSLPYDFNELYSDTTANDSIIEVVQIFLRKANDEHNAEIETLIAQHREDQRASAERELQLKRQNDQLQEENKALQEANNFLAEQASESKLEKMDAEAKRDAAVTKAEGLELLLSEKEAHIQTLRDEAAIGASKAINVTAIEASDRLAALVEQSKSAKIKSAAELALESDIPFRGKVLVDGVVAPPIAPEVPTFQPGDTQTDDTTDQLDETGFIPIPADHQEVAPITFPVQSGDTMVGGTSATDGQGALEERVAKLEATVKELCEVCNIAEVA